MAIIAMDTFLKQLGALNVSIDNTYNAYKRTLDNITSDRHHPDHNPHGNIGQATQAAIEGMCAGKPPTATAHLVGVVEAHYSYQPRAERPGCTTRDGKVIRTVVPKDIFVAHHLMSALEDLFHSDALTSTGGNGETTVPAAALGGRTQREKAPTWWTFGGPEPRCGRAYVEDLALPRTTINKAESAGAVVEIALPATALSVPLHKPSSIDGYGAWSRFKPDLTACSHGMSDPDPGFRPRAELVSESLAYQEIANRAISAGRPEVMVTVKVIAW